MDYGAKSMAASNTSNVDINMEMDEVLKRIQSSRNVAGVMVINNEGIPLKSTLDSSTTVQYGGMVADLALHARSIVRDLDPTNELTFLRYDRYELSFAPHETLPRVKSHKHEVLVAPDESFVIIVLQNARDEE